MRRMKKKGQHIFAVFTQQQIINTELYKSSPLRQSTVYRQQFPRANPSLDPNFRL